MNDSADRTRARRAAGPFGVVLACALLLLPAIVLPAAGAGAASRQPSAGTNGHGTHADLRDAQARLTDLADRIQRGQRVADELRSKVASLAGRLGREQAVYADAERHLGEVRRQLADVTSAHAELQTRLGARTREALTLGSGGQIDLLLGSSSFAEMGDRLEFLDQLQAADQELADQVAATARTLLARQGDLERGLAQTNSVLSDLQTQQAQFLTMFARQQDELRQVANAREQATALVGRLRSQLRAQLSAELLSQVQGGDTAPYGVWAKLFLEHIKAPTCRDNLVAMVAWQASEGTTASWNPLATTYAMPGATALNSVGVRNYVSLSQGLQATQLTLGNGATGYAGILSALHRCAPAMDTARAINASAWCSGCTGGQYVIGIIPTVEAYFDQYQAIQN